MVDKGRLLRCAGASAGVYAVEFRYFETDGVERSAEYIADIGPHSPVLDGAGAMIEDIPRVSQRRPYIGLLCPCELAWLAHIPGKTYSVHRRYTVTKEG